MLSIGSLYQISQRKKGLLFVWHGWSHLSLNQKIRQTYKEWDGKVGYDILGKPGNFASKEIRAEAFASRVSPP